MCDQSDVTEALEGYELQRIGRRNSRKVTAAVFGVTMSCAASIANAASLGSLQGAWITFGTDCGDTFQKVNGQIQFKDRLSSQTTGVIISGDKIVGSNMSCTAGKVREGADNMSVLLSCSDAVMFETMSVSFRVIDKDTFERFDPSFPEISVKYHRCQL